jgi:cellobiose-specific phosphotransferase system component IIB
MARKLTDKQRKYLFSKERDDKVIAEIKKNEAMQKSHGKQSYFLVHAYNPKFNGGTDFEKGISAPSVDYIMKHKSQYFGKGITIKGIDHETYGHVKNDNQLQKEMQKRHGYHVVNGTRVYD